MRWVHSGHDGASSLNYRHRKEEERVGGAPGGRAGASPERMRGPWGLRGGEEEGGGESRRGSRSGEGWGTGIPCGAGSQRGGWRRLRNRAHGILRSTRGVRENWLDPGPSVGKGPWEASGGAHSGAPRSQSGLQARVSGWVCVGALSSLWAPQSCRRAGPLPRGSGPLQAGPPGTPLTRRDCRKVQGLLSSGCFEPPLVALAASPPGAQHTHRGLPARQAPTLQINS